MLKFKFIMYLSSLRFFQICVLLADLCSGSAYHLGSVRVTLCLVLCWRIVAKRRNVSSWV